MEASPKREHRLVPPGAVSGRLLSVQPDAVLCRLCARGSDDAFAALNARYRQQVFAFVFHLLNRPGSVDDAEDLTQEILGKAFSNMSNRREEGSFKAWLFRIARNHTFDHIRARRPIPASFDDPNFATEPSNVISLQQEVEKRSEMNWLLAAMSRLPERQREALVLRELGGMSYDEIGETLETTPEGVKQLIKRGRANVSHAAEEGGYRSKNLGRDLALATPIVTIGWIGAGAGKAGAAVGAAAAATTGSAAVSGGAIAGGTGFAIVGGKVAATVLAVVAVGAGSVVVGEQVSSDRSSGDPQSQSVSGKGTTSPTVPAQSLTLGANASERAKANKIAANARRERAKQRRAQALAKREAAAERAAAGKAHSKKDSAPGRENGSTRPADRGNSSGGKSSDGNSAAPQQGAGNSTGGSGSGGQPSSDQSTTQSGGNGSGNGSANSNAGGNTKD